MRLLQWEWGYLPIWPGIRREALRPSAMLLGFLKERTFRISGVESFLAQWWRV